MAGCKVKITCNGPQATRDSVLRVIKDAGIKWSRLIRVDQKLMLLYCNSPSDVDKMFEDQYLTILSERGCTPQVPPNLGLCVQ